MLDRVKEKLVELLNQASEILLETAGGLNDNHGNGIREDNLITNGVTVQEWISVKDGLPKLIPCDAGTAYSEAVNVLTSGRKVLTAIWDGFDWICDAEYWDAEGEEITHWTPVLLPLPAKEEYE